MEDSLIRANSPTDSGFNVLNPVEDDPNVEPTDEMKHLAKASKSRDGQVFIDHYKEKIEELTTKLKHTNFAGMPSEEVAVTVMAWQKVIQDYEAVLNDVTLSTQVVADAAKRKAQAKQE